MASLEVPVLVKLEKDALYIYDPDTASTLKSIQDTISPLTLAVIDQGKTSHVGTRQGSTAQCSECFQHQPASLMRLPCIHIQPHKLGLSRSDPTASDVATSRTSVIVNADLGSQSTQSLQHTAHNTAVNDQLQQALSDHLQEQSQLAEYNRQLQLLFNQAEQKTPADVNDLVALNHQQQYAVVINQQRPPARVVDQLANEFAILHMLPGYNEQQQVLNNPPQKQALCNPPQQVLWNKPLVLCNPNPIQQQALPNPPPQALRNPPPQALRVLKQPLCNPQQQVLCNPPPQTLRNPPPQALRNPPHLQTLCNPPQQQALCNPPSQALRNPQLNHVVEQEARAQFHLEDGLLAGYNRQIEQESPVLLNNQLQQMNFTQMVGYSQVAPTPSFSTTASAQFVQPPGNSSLDQPSVVPESQNLHWQNLHIAASPQTPVPVRNLRTRSASIHPAESPRMGRSRHLSSRSLGTTYQSRSVPRYNDGTGFQQVPGSWSKPLNVNASSVPSLEQQNNGLTPTVPQWRTDEMKVGHVVRNSHYDRRLHLPPLTASGYLDPQGTDVESVSPRQRHDFGAVGEPVTKRPLPKDDQFPDSLSKSKEDNTRLQKKLHVDRAITISDNAGANTGSDIAGANTGSDNAGANTGSDNAGANTVSDNAGTSTVSDNAGANSGSDNGRSRLWYCYTPTIVKSKPCDSLFCQGPEFDKNFTCPHPVGPVATRVTPSADPAGGMQATGRITTLLEEESYGRKHVGKNVPSSWFTKGQESEMIGGRSEHVSAENTDGSVEQKNLSVDGHVESEMIGNHRALVSAENIDGRAEQEDLSDDLDVESVTIGSHGEHLSAESTYGSDEQKDLSSDDVESGTFGNHSEHLSAESTYGSDEPKDLSDDDVESEMIGNHRELLSGGNTDGSDEPKDLSNEVESVMIGNHSDYASSDAELEDLSGDVESDGESSWSIISTTRSEAEESLVGSELEEKMAERSKLDDKSLATETSPSEVLPERKVFPRCRRSIFSAEQISDGDDSRGGKNSSDTPGKPFLQGQVMVSELLLSINIQAQFSHQPTMDEVLFNCADDYICVVDTVKQGKVVAVNQILQTHIGVHQKVVGQRLTRFVYLKNPLAELRSCLPHKFIYSSGIKAFISGKLVFLKDGTGRELHVSLWMVPLAAHEDLALCVMTPTLEFSEAMVMKRGGGVADSYLFQAAACRHPNGGCGEGHVCQKVKGINYFVPGMLQHTSFTTWSGTNVATTICLFPNYKRKSHEALASTPVQEPEETCKIPSFPGSITCNVARSGLLVAFPDGLIQSFDRYFFGIRFNRMDLTPQTHYLSEYLRNVTSFRPGSQDIETVPGDTSTFRLEKILQLKAPAKCSHKLAEVMDRKHAVKTPNLVLPSLCCTDAPILNLHGADVNANTAACLVSEKRRTSLHHKKCIIDFKTSTPVKGRMERDWSLIALDVGTYNATFSHRDGSKIPVSFRLSRMQYADKSWVFCLWFQLRADGKNIEQEVFETDDEEEDEVESCENDYDDDADEEDDDNDEVSDDDDSDVIEEDESNHDISEDDDRGDKTAEVGMDAVLAEYKAAEYAESHVSRDDDSLMEIPAASFGAADQSLGQLIQTHAAEETVSRSVCEVNCNDLKTAVAGEFSESYSVLEALGEGGFGFVWRAQPKDKENTVVVKFIKKSSMRLDFWTQDTATGKKVPLEVSILKDIGRHSEFIIQVLDVYENEDFVQMVMEDFGDLDLFDFTDQVETDEPLTCIIFRQIVLAVSFLHSRGILHRDIKDENVIINSELRCKLIDFGSASHMLPDGEMFTEFRGTTEYCSPEIHKGHRYLGPEAEMWALGVTLYTILFHVNPFPPGTFPTQLMDTDLPEPVSPDFAELVLGLLECDPNRRLDLAGVTRSPWLLQEVDQDKYAWSHWFGQMPDENESSAHEVEQSSFQRSFTT